ncbi:MAG: hypothetical protein IPG69_14645 [Flavobacteriales bacterium]|nr:hypothetical protein [Flavobacteriales bacterium]
MSTLSECVDSFIENITVTDRQESSISQSVKNLNEHLKNKEAKMGVRRTFTAGSWERDTIIRPLDDVDVFAVLDPAVWQDEYGQRSSPQSVLVSLKNYLNGLSDYEGKVTQDRPCVTIQLSHKHIDVLPCFQETGRGYLMPSSDLKFWIFTDPELLEQELATATTTCKFVKGIIKAVKHWKREHDISIPSFHAEEVTVAVSRVVTISDHASGIKEWFKRAEIPSGSSQSSTQAPRTIKPLRKSNRRKSVWLKRRTT